MLTGAPAKRSAVRRIVAATGGILLNQIVRAVQQFLWVPLYLSTWGKQGYGEWLTLVSIVGYTALSDIGVQMYWANVLTGLEVRGDYEGYRRVFRCGLALLMGSAMFVVVLTMVLLWFADPASYFDFKFIAAGQIWLILIVLITTALATLASNMVRGVYRTTGNFPLVLRFQNVRDVAVLILVAIALALDVPPLGVALTLLFVAVGMLLWAVIDARSRFPHLVDLRLHRADSAIVFELIRKGSFFLVGRLSSLALIQTPPLIAARLLGPAMAAMFVAARTIANLTIQLAGAVTQSALPEYSRLEAAGNRMALASMLHRSTGVAILAAGLACVTLFGIGPELFTIWTRGEFTECTLLIRLLALAVLAESFRGSLHGFLVGCNRHRSVALASSGAATLSLIVMLLTAPVLGVSGLPVGVISGSLLVGIPVAAMGMNEVIGSADVRRLLFVKARTVVLLAVLLAGILTLEQLTPIDFTREIATAIGAVVFTVVAYFWTVTVEDRSKVGAILRRVLRRWSWRDKDPTKFVD